MSFLCQRPFLPYFPSTLIKGLYSCFAPFQHFLNFLSGVSEIPVRLWLLSPPVFLFFTFIDLQLECSSTSPIYVLSSCQPRVVLVVLFSPFTLALLLAYFIYIFSSFSLNSCALPSHCLALSQIIAASLSFSHFFVKNLRVNPCLVLVGLFLRLSYSRWLIPTSFPKSFICFVRKRKEAFKKSPAFRVKFFSRVNLRAAQRDPGGVNEQKE